MKFRVVITNDNIRVIQLEAVPESLQALKDVLNEKCDLSGDDITVQYKDPDFGDFVNLTETSILENLMSLKVLRQKSETTDEPTPTTSSEDGATNFRKGRWPKGGYS